MTNTDLKIFDDIQTNLRNMYIKKNNDYGNSFDKTFDEFGLLSAVIRLNDKVNRINTLVKGTTQKVNESIEDTIQDMAVYAILTLMNIKKTK